LTRIAAYCCHFAEGARDGQQMATRYHELSSYPDLTSPPEA